MLPAAHWLLISADPPGPAPPVIRPAAHWLLISAAPPGPAPPVIRLAARRRLLLLSPSAPPVPAVGVPGAHWFLLSAPPLDVATVAPGAGLAVLATTLDAVLEAVRASLVAAGLAPDNRAIVSMTAEPDPIAGGVMLVLMPGGFTPAGPYRDGLGRGLARLDGSFTVDVVDESARDIAQQDRLRLLTPSLGLLATAHGVMETLHGEFVEDGSGNFLSIEPTWVASHSQPRPYGRSPEWAAIRLTFTLSYVARMGGAG